MTAIASAKPASAPATRPPRITVRGTVIQAPAVTIH